MGKLSKKGVRESYIIKRYAIDDSLVKEKSAKIFERLNEYNLLDNKNNIFIYCSYKNEVETYNIIKTLIEAGKTVIVPYMTKDYNGLMMQIVELKSITELIEGPMGIPQPKQHSLLKPFVFFKANEIHAAIIPGVAFDNNLNRIGYGKGMYDRVLPLLNSNCLKIALAFEIQMMSDLIEFEEHDVKMDYIITEKRIII